ncbi:tetratricopeptide repeat protein [Pararhizobium gei]|uniref:tetratricopeptide repeat protein n=1 Tax=Pararhizobium gei TaxID=1395951 RepID=UPI0023DBF65F|nr:tetratricopeptide repeat protein [Rhizobium gei]
MKNAMNRRISLINAALLAAVSLLSIAAIAIPQARASAMLPADQCDAEAGSEHDLQRNLSFRPVATEDLRIGLALSACREAFNQGSGARQTFQLARVLHAAGQQSQAFTMLKKASEDGHAAAMVNYAVMLGERGEPEAEFQLYQKAAAAGNILAAYNLGVAYRDGVGTVADGALAAQWFERASAAQDHLGAFNLAVMLDEGVQIPEDNTKAARFYRLAADRGNVDAMINLGLMLEKGEGVKADPAAAGALFSKAAEKGDEYALSKLAAPQIDIATTADIEPGEQASLTVVKSGRME